MFPEHVQIVEVGLRDGLQSESIILTTEQKLTLLDGLIAAGLKRIQVASFVNPQRVPQMADADALCQRLPMIDGVIYSGLVLNQKGLQRAADAGLRHVDMGISASDTHSQKNTGKTTAEALAELEEMLDTTRSLNLTARGAIQCAFGCVYEGKIDEKRVLDLARRFIDLGVDELALADSTGMANPVQICRIMGEIVPMAGDVPVILHLHDTRGLGLANLLAALDCGITQFDTAFGGLGGCPFIPGAAGNIATEDTIYMLDEMDIETGITRHAVGQVSRQAEAWLGHEFAGKMYKLSEPPRRQERQEVMTI
jgi:hydroxymethylglutaryl-CoA lyase